MTAFDSDSETSPMHRQLELSDDPVPTTTIDLVERERELTVLEAVRYCRHLLAHPDPARAGTMRLARAYLRLAGVTL